MFRKLITIIITLYFTSEVEPYELNHLSFIWADVVATMKVKLPNDFCSSSLIHVVILTILRSTIRYTNADWTSYDSDGKY